MPRAAELFVHCLENEGVRYVFGIPGEETLDLNEALDHSSSQPSCPSATSRARVHGRRLRPADRATPGCAWARSGRARPTS